MLNIAEILGRPVNLGERLQSEVRVTGLRQKAQSGDKESVRLVQEIGAKAALVSRTGEIIEAQDSLTTHFDLRSESLDRKNGRYLEAEVFTRPDGSKDLFVRDNMAESPLHPDDAHKLLRRPGVKAVQRGSTLFSSNHK